VTEAKTKLSLRERNKIRMRAELLDVVLDLFVADIPAALNIENIARQAGCSKATVYVYFPGGLNEMLCAIYEEISGEVTAEGMLLRDAATTPQERIMGLAGALLNMAARPRRGKFFAQLNPTLSPALQPVLGRSSQRYSDMLAEDLDSQSMAVLLVGAFREASIRVAKEPGRKERLLNAIAQLVEGLIADLHSKSKGTIP